jgi:hypothetical protein
MTEEGKAAGLDESKFSRTRRPDDDGEAGFRFPFSPRTALRAGGFVASRPVLPQPDANSVELVIGAHQ